MKFTYLSEIYSENFNLRKIVMFYSILNFSLLCNTKKIIDHSGRRIYRNPQNSLILWQITYIMDLMIRCLIFYFHLGSFLCYSTSLLNIKQ